MTDRELLELAAKAAGKHKNIDGVIYAGFGSREWNPLTDDGDALRLDVKLKISTEYTNAGVYAGPDADNEDWYHEFFNSDPYAATRRAIVLAAAEIGKAMK